MSISHETIAEDPSLYLFDVQNDVALFQPMTREGFARSIFLDNRIVRGGRGLVQMPLQPVMADYRGPPAKERPIGLIFHVAQCGSTLLARALDLLGRVLVLREPIALRRLGVEAGSNWSGALDTAEFTKRLDFVLSMLGKRWEAGTPVIAKANVPVNFIARQVMDCEPDTAAILLHFPLEDYVAAVMRTEGHERWVDAIFEEMKLAASLWAADREPRTTAERAACLWFAQMKAFEDLPRDYANVRSLSAGVFFGDPASTIDAAAELFGIALENGEAAAIAKSEIFKTYSKNPALDYDPEVRAAREAEALRRLSAEISAARDWVGGARAAHGLADALGSPLLGEPVACSASANVP